ncbi:MAG: pilus assembly protein TadG-related protein [Gemmatimonadota bacterium]
MPGGKHLTLALRDQRGAALVISTSGVFVVLAAVALAVDVGMMLSAKAEAQRVADLSALAGAGHFALNDNSAAGEAVAIAYAADNLIRKQPAEVLPMDVFIDVPNEQVTVSVHRTAARGNPVSTAFARIFGVPAVDVVADATAEIVSTSGVLNCILPIAIADQWQENGGDPDLYDDPPDVYVPWDPDNPAAPYTGYSDSSIGDTIVLRPFGGGPGEINESWYYAWRPPGQHGAADHRENIWGCVDPTIEYSIGMSVNTEPGNMIGPTRQGFDKLVGLDANAIWNTNPGMSCVTDASLAGSNDPLDCRGSVRIKPTPLFNPGQPPGNGAKPFVLTNFAGIFVLGITGNEVTGIFVGYTGVGPGGVDAGVGNTLLKKLRLIE